MKRNYHDVKMNGIMTNMVHNVPVLNTMEKSSKQIITLAYSIVWSYRHLKTNSHDLKMNRVTTYLTGKKT